MSTLRVLKSILKHTAGFARNDSVQEFAKSHPLITAGLVVPATQFLTQDVASPIVGGISEATGGFGGLLGPDSERLFDSQMESMQGVAVDRMRSARIQDMVERNIAAIKRMSPHLHDQILAGRILPQGAVVLGGNPRTDLLEELAYNMGTSSTPDEFSQLL